MDIFEDIEDILDNDLYGVVDHINRQRTYVVNPRPNYFEELHPKEFYKRFRLSKESVSDLLNKIGDQLQNPSERNVDRSVEPMVQLLLTLRFFATGCFYISIGDFAGVHKSTAGKIIQRVVTVICSLRPNYINLPRNAEEREQTATDFYALARFANVAGTIDCTHIKLQSPGGENAEIFRNRKGYFSLNVQVVCNSKHKITDIVCRWPGSTHDSYIFNNSAIKITFENGEMENYTLLGDSGYPLKRYLLTPIQNPQNEVENLYNESQIRTRNVIERTFGIWKRRFPILSRGIRTRLELAQKIIVACAILHNIACDQNIELPDDELNYLDGEEINIQEREHDDDDMNARDNIIDYFRNLVNQNIHI